MCEVIERNRAEGRAEGIGSVNKLNAILIAARRFADLERATKDSAYQAQLLKELLKYLLIKQMNFQIFQVTA